MGLAIDSLKKANPDPGAIDAFIQGHQFPIVEGSKVTFCYRGAAEAVHLKSWVYGLPNSQKLQVVNKGNYKQAQATLAKLIAKS